MKKQSKGDILLWSITTSVMWMVAGVVTGIIFYQNENRIPTTTSTPEHLIVLMNVLILWGAFGFIIGLIALFHFSNLASSMGSIHAYPIHIFHLSIVALVIGCLIGSVFYPLISPPPGAFLRSIEWRVPICAIAALSAMNISLNIITKLPYILSEEDPFK